MPESFLLDPTSENTGTQLDVSTDPYAVSAFSSPTPPQETATSGSIDTEGDAINARRHQNRQVSLTVEVTGTSQANLDSNVATLEAKVAKLATQGDPTKGGVSGTFRRVRTDGTFRTYDVLTVDQYEKAFDVLYFVGNMAVCQINLIAEPYARGVEVSVGSFAETTLPMLTFAASSPAGDVPAIGRLRITDTQNIGQAKLWWGMESRYYDAATSLLYQAESQTLRAGTTSGADATASGGSRTSTSATSTSYTELLAFTGAHVGSYRVFVRAQTSSIAANSAVYVRLGYAYNNDTTTGSLLLLNTTRAATFIAAADWELLDLGVITIPKVTLGTQSWVGRLQAINPGGGANTLLIDYIWLVPVEQSGEFTQTSNYLNSRPLIAGLSSEVRSDGVQHQDTSTTWSPATSYEGDYLRVPVGTSSRFTIKGARSVFNDPNIDDISAQLWVTPRYLALN